MQLGIIGLGRMGADIAQRVMRQGHECVVFDWNTAAVAALTHRAARTHPTVASGHYDANELHDAKPITSWNPLPHRSRRCEALIR
jgi:6-phosphogluconate dehydrogenase (decarboxylating)